MMHMFFRDGSRVVGKNATDILEQISGGWNPRDIFMLRRALLHRSGVYGGITKVEQLKELEREWDLLSDEEFLFRLDKEGFITVKPDVTPERRLWQMGDL